MPELHKTRYIPVQFCAMRPKLEYPLTLLVWLMSTVLGTRMSSPSKSTAVFKLWLARYNRCFACSVLMSGGRCSVQGKFLSVGENGVSHIWLNWSRMYGTAVWFAR